MSSFIMNSEVTISTLLHSHPVGFLAPEITLTLFALVVLLAGAFFPDAAQRRAMPVLGLLGALVSALTTIPLWSGSYGAGRHIFGLPGQDIYAVDDFSLFFKWVFLAGLVVTILISSRFLSARSGDRHTVVGEYYALLMLSTVGMMFVAGAKDLLIVFLGIETFSIALYVLAGFARARLMSNEAALKYFLLGAFATGFMLYGIALVYFAVGTTRLPDILTRLTDSNGHALNGAPDAVLYGGIGLILIGLGFKAALVPFHQWTPDVYEGSPTPVTAFMAVGAKAAAFAALLRVLPGAFATPGMIANWFHILLVMAVLTMTVGNLIALGQESLKRMLAYSSIAHAGYLLVGLLAVGSALHASGTASTMVGGANSAESSDLLSAAAGVIFYLAVYAVMNLGAFAVLVSLENARNAQGDPNFDSEDANILVNDVRGLAWRQPAAAAALTVFLFSLAGIPPTAGFFGKLYIFQSAIGQGMVGLVIVGVINTVISVYYYLRPVVAIYMQGEHDVEPALVVSGEGTVAAKAASGLTIGVALAILSCTVAVIGMVVLQAPLLTWASAAARSLFLGS
jgi:NADH-quinone oxidoreductase subunit N